MNNQLTFIFSIFIFILFPNFGHSQGVTIDIPEIGKTCPNYELKDLDYYHKKKVSIKDFLGSFLILDFFSADCISCFESFPKVNRINNDFKGKIRFLVIGYKDEKIKSVFEKFRIRQNLVFPVAYDSAIFKKFKISSVPHVIWIDDKGIVQAITSSNEITEGNLDAFLRKSKFDFIDQSNKKLEERKNLYDHNKPLLVNGNGGEDTVFLFRSILSPWAPSISQYVPSQIGLTGKFQGTGLLLSWLYFYAYIGQSHLVFGDSLYGVFYDQLILNIQDSSDFSFDFKTGKSIYNYSIIINKKNPSVQRMQEFIKSDLKQYFGYNIKVESRKMPCWKLVATDSTKRILRTNENRVFREIIPPAGFSLKNAPIKSLLSIITAYNQKEPPFFDETSIDYNIDIAIDAIVTDLNDIRHSLQKYGLNLIKDEKEMKVLIITSSD